MQIIVDTREKERKKQALNYYTKKHETTPKIKQLPTADYTFTHNNITTAYEYKTIPDFLSSIPNKTVFQETSNQTQEQAYHYNYLIIQGDLMETLRDRYKVPRIRNKYTNYKHYLESHIKRYQGAKRRCLTILPVIEVKTQNQAFEEMYQQSLNCSTPKNYGGIIRQVNKHDPNANPIIIYLSSIGDVGEITAKKLIAYHNCKTLTDLTRLTTEDLEEVPGIGEKTAKLIKEWL